MFNIRSEKVPDDDDLGRLFKGAQRFDYGAITASKACYTDYQNEQRFTSLLAKLRVVRYSVTSFKGATIANYQSPVALEMPARIFFVLDIQGKKNLEHHLRELGEYFEQDSVLYGKAGEPSVLIGTSNQPNAFPGLGVVDPQGGAIFDSEGKIISRIHGRPFVFDEALYTYSPPKYPTEFRGPVVWSQMNWWDIHQ